MNEFPKFHFHTVNLTLKVNIWAKLGPPFSLDRVHCTPYCYDTGCRSV